MRPRGFVRKRKSGKDGGNVVPITREETKL
jgi:hypothetical protein